jgi:short-subunit dehydrogenase
MKKVLITGASQGIGQAIAQKFLDENYEVHNISRHTTTIFTSSFASLASGYVAI